MAEIYDNLGYLPQQEGRGAKLAEALHHTMEFYDCLDIATGYMNLSAWNEFADEIGRAPFEPCEDPKKSVPVARILLGMVPRSVTELMHAEAQARCAVRSCRRRRRIMSVGAIVMSWFSICVLS